MFDWITDPNAWIAFGTLTVLEIVLGVDNISVMIAAIVVAVLFMMVSAQAISDFIDKHPTVKMLALSFLLMVGVALVGEGLDFHLPRGYIYFAMAFSVFVEMLNLRIRKTKTA